MRRWLAAFALLIPWVLNDALGEPLGEWTDRALELALAAVPAAFLVTLLRVRLARGAVADDFGDCLLEARAEVRHGTVVERGASLGSIAQGCLETGQREMRLRTPEHGTRQGDGGMAAGGGGLDLGAARIAEPEELGELLLSRAFDLEADLMVMGCYGHSRAREWVLGGTSRTVLRSMTLPVLMAH